MARLGEQVFRSSISLALYIPVCLFLIGEATFEFISAQGNFQSYQGCAALLCASILVFFVWLGFTRYIISMNELLIISGPFHLRYPLAQIVDVQPTRSILTAPALSFDRIEVRFRSGASVVVSPARKAAFIEALMAPNAGFPQT